jgi:hypothetical protein
MAAAELPATLGLTMGVTKEASEKWFERYLRDTGHAGAERHEPYLGIPRRPDYLVSKGSGAAVCEVKEFSTSALDRRISASRGNAFSMSPADLDKASARRVRDAAEKLEPLRLRSIPLVAVLANPRDVWLGVELSKMASGATRFPFLSAVVVLTMRQHARDYVEAWLAEHGDAIRRASSSTVEHANALYEALSGLETRDGDYMRVDVIHTRGSQLGHAVPLSRSLFDGPHDKHWLTDATGYDIVARDQGTMPVVTAA